MSSSMIASEASQPYGGSIADAVERSLRRRQSQIRRRQRIILCGQILLPVLLLAWWEAAVRSGRLAHADAFYSQPSAVLTFAVTHARELVWQSWATMKAVVIGCLAGMTLGGAAGLLLGSLPMANRILDPLISVLAGLPRIALAPLFLVWFGIGVEAKIFLSFSLVLFIMLINVRGAVRTVDRELLIAARLLGATRTQILSKVVAPAITPILVESLRLSVVFSVLGVIASEMITARDGLGISIVRYSQTLQPAGVFAVLLVLAVIMGAISAAIGLLERRVLRWQAEA